MKILGLIPARGGSKGLPDKNIKPLAGRPLIARAWDSARESGVLSRVICSTDDDRIAALAREVGLDVPFMRPDALAADDSAMIDVAIHALKTLADEGEHYDALFLLQPTSPLRTAEHIKNAVALLADNDAVCSVVPLPQDLCPHYVMRITEDGFLDYFLPEGKNYTRRQDVPLAYRREGTLFLTRSEVILEQRSFYGERCVPMPLDPSESQNIDTPEEWEEAEARLVGQG